MCAGGGRQTVCRAHALEARLEQGEGAAQIHGRLVGDCPDLLERAERETGQLENQPLRAAALDTVRWRRGHVAPDSGHVPAARLPAAYNPETPVDHRPGHARRAATTSDSITSR